MTRALLLELMAVALISFGCGSDTPIASTQSSSPIANIPTGNIDFSSGLLPVQGIQVDDPTSTPTLTIVEARKVLGNQAPSVSKAQIVNLTLSEHPNGTRTITGQFLAWALELDLRHVGDTLNNVRDFLDDYECNGRAYPGPGGFNQVVVFVEANDGQCLGFFISQSGDVID